MQDGTHCRSSWKGSAQAPSDDACSGCQVHQGSPQRMGRKHCKTPRLCFVMVAICCFFLFSLVFQFVHSIRFVRHSFFGSRKEPRIHITILQFHIAPCANVSCPKKISTVSTEQSQIGVINSLKQILEKIMLDLKVLGERSETSK